MRAPHFSPAMYSTAAQAIGYKELISHLKGECSLAEAVEQIKISSARYAKRQLTWFRHVEGAVHIFVDDGEGNMLRTDELCREVVLTAERLLSCL